MEKRNLTLQCLLVVRDRKSVAKHLKDRMRILKLREFVREHRIGSRLILELTEKGSARLTAWRIQHSTPLPQGVHVRVEYDFPETQRLARDNFRYFLKKNGFVRFQKSIWLCRRDVYKVLCDFVCQHELGDWVDIICGRPAAVPRRRQFI